MVEELGEVAKVINIMYGDKNLKKDESINDLKDELGAFLLL